VTYEPILRYGFAHEQTQQTSVFYYRHRHRPRQRPRRVTVPAVPSLRQLASADNLIDTYYSMRSRAGQAPGPDGLSYCDLSPGEVAHILRELSAAVLAGSYRPGPTRQVRIPKPRGGHRTLSVGNLCDRVVAAALNTALGPLWEAVFLPCSYGFRKDRGVWLLLAELAAAMSREGLWVLALADIRDAFPSVLVDDAVTDHGRYILEPSLLALVGVVLRGGDAERPRGIDQGSAYSPTALNVRLHHALDLGANQGHHPLRHYFRYADDCAPRRREGPGTGPDSERHAA
jgi:RNA-directed DNA polymerase